jgi:Tfp pilus assembly protein PilF
LRILTIIALVCGCAPKNVTIQEPEPWRTEQGRLNVNLELANKFLDLGELDKAQGILSYLRSLDEEGPEIDLLQGRILYAQGLYDQAEPLLLMASKRLGNDPRPGHALGLLYTDTDRVDDAIATYSKVVKVADNDAKAWNNLGFLLYSKKRCVEAVDAMEHAVHIAGTSSKYQNNLGFALVCNGQDDKAYQVFRSAVGPAGAYYNIGHVYELEGEWGEAHRHFNKALHEDPGYLPAREGLRRLESPTDSRDLPAEDN